MKILYITMCLPYENVSHAGGKTVYYYMSQLSKKANLTLISKVRDSEKKYLKKIPNNCKLYQVCLPENKMKRICAYLGGINSKVNPYYRYGNTLLKYIYMKMLRLISNLKTSGYYPDVIIMEWTQISLMINDIKKIYPDALYISSEHDITFQSLERKISKSKGFVKLYYNCQYKNFKKRELSCLAKSDIILIQSEKDKDILINNRINRKKLLVISPFYMSTNRKWKGKGKNNIVIYGDMSRIENYGAAIWFIENVFSKIDNSRIKLYILGGNPSKELYKYENERIIITGFVNSIFDYLDDSFCMVAPLQIGAGIKVKCIEALSYGIPLLANDIAIEGIDVISGVDYLHCNTADEFLYNINKLYSNIELQSFISDNSIFNSKKHFNLDISFQNFFNFILNGLRDKNCKGENLETKN